MFLARPKRNHTNSKLCKSCSFSAASHSRQLPLTSVTHAQTFQPATCTLQLRLGPRTWNLDLGLGLCQRLCLHPDHSEHVSRLATATKSFSMAIAKCRKKQKAYTIPDSFMNFTIFICFMSFSCFGFSLSSFRLLQLYLGIVCIFILFVQFLS